MSQQMTTLLNSKRQTMSQGYYQVNGPVSHTLPISGDIFTIETHCNPLLPLLPPSPIHPLSHQEVRPWLLAKKKKKKENGYNASHKTEEIKFRLLWWDIELEKLCQPHDNLKNNYPRFLSFNLYCFFICGIPTTEFFLITFDSQDQVIPFYNYETSNKKRLPFHRDWMCNFFQEGIQFLKIQQIIWLGMHFVIHLRTPLKK